MSNKKSNKGRRTNTETATNQAINASVGGPAARIWDAYNGLVDTKGNPAKRLELLAWLKNHAEHLVLIVEDARAQLSDENLNGLAQDAGYCDWHELCGMAMADEEGIYDAQAIEDKTEILRALKSKAAA